MSHDRSPQAEQILSSLRASADPAPGAERRVLAAVEQRILFEAGALQTNALDTGTSGVARRASVVQPLASLSRQPRIAAVSRGAQFAQISGRLGRWGLFGLVAGVIGYQLGVRHERAANDAVASQVVAVGSSGEGTRAAAPLELPLPMASMPPAPEALPPTPVAAPSQPPSVSSLEAATPSRSTRRHPTRATSRRATLGRVAEPPPAPHSDAAHALSMNEILERLQRAQKALHGRQPQAALMELDSLDALERQGALGDERRVLRALALCDIGLIGDARQVLSQLEGRAAESIYRGRLEQACGAALEP